MNIDTTVPHVVHLPYDPRMEEIPMWLPANRSHSLAQFQKKCIGDLYRELV
jgi:hypothetical protein